LIDSKNEFEAVAMVHLSTVYRVAFALCGRKELADDMVQMTFLKAYENFGSFKKDSYCKAWLLRILRNTWIDHLRHNKHEAENVSLPEEMLADEHSESETIWSNAEDLLENFSDDQIIKAMSDIPDDQRLTLYLTDVEQLDHEQVAEIMEVAVGTVKSRASRARAKLKVMLSAYAKEMGFDRGEK
jgi:RNA polymerase sigma-70 factor (ECF subfamily)